VVSVVAGAGAAAVGATSDAWEVGGGRNWVNLWLYCRL